MAIFISESEVQELFPMEKAFDCVEASLVEQHRGRAVNRPRQRIFLPHVSLHYMAAALPGENWLGMKIYTIARSGWRFLVLLYDSESGDLLAVVEADQLGRIRTGAASGVATQYMARTEARRVGIIGAGRQARTQLAAVAQVRQLTGVRVYSRDETRRRTFADEMSRQLRLEVEPAPTAETAVRFGDIVITATNAREPVLFGAWLPEGVHINAIGANMSNRREVDGETLARASVIAVDSLEQAKQEAGDLIQGLPFIRGGWDAVVELHEIVGRSHPARQSEAEITLFKSSGIALWDVAAAGYIYRQAVQQGKGRELEIWKQSEG